MKYSSIITSLVERLGEHCVANSIAWCDASEISLVIADGKLVVNELVEFVLEEQCSDAYLDMLVGSIAEEVKVMDVLRAEGCCNYNEFVYKQLMGQTEEVI